MLNRNFIMKKLFAIILICILFLTSCAVIPKNNNSESTDTDSGTVQAEKDDIVVYTLTPQVPTKNGVAVQNVYDVDKSLSISSSEGYVEGNDYVIIQTPEVFSKLISSNCADFDKTFDKEFFEEYFVVATIRADEVDPCFAEVTYKYAYDAENNVLTLTGEYASAENSDCNGLVTSCLDIIVLRKDIVTGIFYNFAVNVEHPKATNEQKQKHVRSISLDKLSEYPKNFHGLECDDMPVIDWKNYGTSNSLEKVNLKSFDLGNSGNTVEKIGAIDNYALLKEVFEAESGVSVDSYYSETIFEKYFFIVIVRTSSSAYVQYDITIDHQTKQLEICRNYLYEIGSYSLEIGSECIDFIPVLKEKLGSVNVSDIFEYNFNLTTKTVEYFE